MAQALSAEVIVGIVFGTLTLVVGTLTLWVAYLTLYRPQLPLPDLERFAVELVAWMRPYTHISDDQSEGPVSPPAPAAAPAGAVVSNPGRERSHRRRS
ncbi:hypothetical protein B0T19DRAFT_479925 [Cercophora scortea]|uniref:Uncharacterized protein n=1 Tax=Cercophora scortea TaxID=314031 RepID=A0AAE0I215_9PEZI|nr:hypothetical protein B0T19DRAFT_479925 [Cercophora scortea]